MDFHQWAESMVYEQAHSYADMTRKDIENFGLHTCIWSKKRFPAPEMKTLRYPKGTPTALPTSLNESSSGAGTAGWSLTQGNSVDNGCISRNFRC